MCLLPRLGTPGSAPTLSHGPKTPEQSFAHLTSLALTHLVTKFNGIYTGSWARQGGRAFHTQSVPVLQQQMRRMNKAERCTGATGWSGFLPGIRCSPWCYDLGTLGVASGTHHAAGALTAVLQTAMLSQMLKAFSPATSACSEQLSTSSFPWKMSSSRRTPHT